MNDKKKEPLFHIVKRDALPWYQSVGIRAIAIVLALIVCAVVTMILTGTNPILKLIFLRIKQCFQRTVLFHASIDQDKTIRDFLRFFFQSQASAVLLCSRFDFFLK